MLEIRREHCDDYSEKKGRNKEGGNRRKLERKWERGELQGRKWERRKRDKEKMEK